MLNLQYQFPIYICISQLFLSGLKNPVHEEVANHESSVNVTLKVHLRFHLMIA